MNAPPTRLRDDPAAADSLREDLARAERSPVQAYDQERGLARLRAAIALGAGGDGGGGETAGGSAATGSAAIAKWVGLALVGGVAIGGGFALRDRSAAPAPVAPLATPAPATPITAQAPAPEDAVPSESPIAPVADAPAAPERAHEAVPQRKAPAARRAVDPDEALRREIAALAEARRLSARDPQAALTLAERGHREFPRGMFREEREAIAIFALDALGRTSAARQRATSFLARYPNGPFSERMQRTVLALAP